MTEPEYQPIDCALHSRFELAAMHATALRICWVDGGGTRLERLRAVDIRIRDRAEYLVAETLRGEARWIRLDRILEAQGLPGAESG